MALLHRDHDTTTDDTVSGPTPTWPTSTTSAAASEPTVVRKNSFGQTLRTIIATVLLVAVVAIAIANTDEVGIDLLFEQYDAPLSALVGGAALAGFLIGALLARGRRRHA
jgi:uncharacterized integral membrane protein